MSAIIGPIVEELFFRGLIYKSFEQKFSPTVTIISSALLFGIMHISPFSTVFVGCISGIIKGYMLYKSKSIYVTIWMHIIGNGILMSISILS
ncbi:hypothetical protein AN639_10255 [Candidatus Epulonipiscium fishelsonii]|uniref:Uncharacterized protein n=1 Tax=Candidatus Epulonipiscium fishelsonii TaxID=77094 RepID=A0ACC8XBM8_9FIRM|nr:hypothetical protein AN396_00985 [Epulopiscium sp. SCG-B11WGA-EpuloA1]ONI43562.1 hypothetical protein AN639_10255 [Epulopiscium sp. SCG-B05WGA-EpuloA1]